MTAHLKTPLAYTQNRFAEQKIADAVQLFGKALPCNVISRNGSFVTVGFAVTSKFTLPKVTIPIAGSEYGRMPIRAGCKGVVIPCDVRIGNVSGLVSSDPGLNQPGNLSALFFIPMGNKNFVSFPDVNVVLYSDPSACVMQVTPTGVTVTGSSGALSTTGALAAGNGWSGTFRTGDSRTVTVVSGIITSVA